MSGTRDIADPSGGWQRAASLAELERTGRKLFRSGGRQIALFLCADGVFACNNRCPHEGYPLCEGDLDAGHLLTCNWHNWKFDLASGENLYGGDRLRVYPVSVRDGDVWVRIVDPPLAERSAEVMHALREAFDDDDYTRLARELARLEHIGAEPLDAVRSAVEWSHDRLEFGWSHAFAGAADWLALRDENEGDAERRLICLLECIGHMADDVLREPRYAFDESRAQWHESRFVAAVESEDEARAVALMRGALGDGIGFAGVERALARAALAHYNDFGHSLIYVTKAGALVARLGERVAAPLLLSLTRSLVYARREDRVPEFRGYAAALAAWGEGEAGAAPDAASWRRLGIERALEATLRSSSAAPERIHSALLGANAWNMLAFDVARQEAVDVPVSDNVGWLDFTHALTFANAVRVQCGRFPELWPAGLLQMACFSGRNARYTLRDADIDRWRVDDVEDFLARAVASLYDHGREEFIVSVHLLKTVLAVRGELGAGHPPEVRDILAAALNRFLASPMKRKHTRRTAIQALKFVALD